MNKKTLFKYYHRDRFQMLLLIILGFLALPNLSSTDQVHFWIQPIKHPLVPNWTPNMIHLIFTDVTMFGYRPQLLARASATKLARCVALSQTEQGLKKLTFLEISGFSEEETLQKK